ncbi:MAG: hypothetical protein ACI8QC_002435 [Planctomycetota bacterium]|jgi:hypothetical protein
MKDIWFHLGLFLAASTIIVMVSCMFSEADDAKALKSFPRRWTTFIGGCALVAVLMLVAEHTFASIN